MCWSPGKKIIECVQVDKAGNEGISSVSALEVVKLLSVVTNLYLLLADSDRG